MPAGSRSSPGSRGSRAWRWGIGWACSPTSRDCTSSTAADRDSRETPVRGLGRWRIAAGAVVVFTALAALAAAHWAAARYVRATAERLAATTAAYVSPLSPAARGPD